MSAKVQVETTFLFLSRRVPPLWCQGPFVSVALWDVRLRFIGIEEPTVRSCNGLFNAGSRVRNPNGRGSVSKYEEAISICTKQISVACLLSDSVSSRL